MLPNKTTTNDFNLPVVFRPFLHKGLADEYSANRFFSNYGPTPSLGFPQMRQTISWRPQNTKNRNILTKCSACHCEGAEGDCGNLNHSITQTAKVLQKFK